MLYIFARSINKKKKIPFLRRLFDASVLKEQKKDNYLCMVSRIVYRRVKNKKRKERNKERREVRIRCWRDEEDIIITVIITIIRNTPATPHFRFHLQYGVFFIPMRKNRFDVCDRIINEKMGTKGITEKTERVNGLSER